MAKQETLTAKKFGELLEAHPRFNVSDSVWVSHATGKPCGGCAMTLAYYHETKTPVAKLDGPTACVWAENKYGEDYVGDFINGFDLACEYEGMPTKMLNPGTRHGIACHKKAVRMGRLPADD